MNTAYKTICFEEKAEIGYLTLSDPPANKMTRLFFDEFNQVVRKQIVNSKVKGIIIAGKGRHFSSGADLEQVRESVGPNTHLNEMDEVVSFPAWFVENRTTFDFFYNLPLPVISSINGLCVGSGSELALCSHLRICGNGSILGLPESTFGLLPGACGTHRVLNLLGLGKALELVLSGETFSADEALEMGFVDRIVKKDDNLAYCSKLMQFILDTYPNYSKQNIIEYLREFETQEAAQRN